MPVFAYVATDEAGKIVRGRYEGGDEKFVTERLEESGYTVARLGLEDVPDSVIKVVNMILMHAVKDDASDIIVEPQQKGVHISYRIDGVLKEHPVVSEVTEDMLNDMLAPLVKRIKTMADVDITESRLPQEGCIYIQMHDKDYRLHVHTHPTQYGEEIAMRIISGHFD